MSINPMVQIEKHDRSMSRITLVDFNIAKNESTPILIEGQPLPSFYVADSKHAASAAAILLHLVKFYVAQD